MREGYEWHGAQNPIGKCILCDEDIHMGEDLHLPYIPLPIHQECYDLIPLFMAENYKSKFKRFIKAHESEHRKIKRMLNELYTKKE